jgi:hypothetical protein
MKTQLKILASAFLALLTINRLILAEDTQPTLPASVQAAFRQEEADIVKVKATLADKLRKAEVEAAKQNNIELAVWLKAEIEKLSSAKVVQTIEGKWRYEKKGWDVILDFTSDGKFTSSDGFTGVWTQNGDVVRFVIDGHSDWWNTIKVSEGSGDSWDNGVKSAQAKRL